MRRLASDHRDHRASGRLAPALVVAATTGYAILRYHVAGEVPWRHALLWTANKGLAWAAVVLLAGAAWRRGTPGSGRAWRDGWTLAAAHVVCSVLLLRPAEYPRLFAADGRLSWAGTVALAAGVAAAVILSRRLRRLGTQGWLTGCVGAALALHSLAVGWPTVLQPATWPAGLLPVSLLGAATGLFLSAAGVRAARRAPATTTPAGAPERQVA